MRDAARWVLVAGVLSATGAHVVACSSTSSGGGGSSSSSSGGFSSSSGSSGGSGGGGPCAGIGATHFVTTTGMCAAGGMTSVPVTVGVTMFNDSGTPLAIDSYTVKWYDSVPSPEPAWCGLSNTSHWTLSGSPVPAHTMNAMLTLETTETCSGWPMGTTGGCLQQLDIVFVTQCGTFHTATPDAIQLDVQ